MFQNTGAKNQRRGKTLGQVEDGLQVGISAKWMDELCRKVHPFILQNDKSASVHPLSRSSSLSLILTWASTILITDWIVPSKKQRSIRPPYRKPRVSQRWVLSCTGSIVVSRLPVIVLVYSQPRERDTNLAHNKYV